MGDAGETRAVDASLMERLAGPALPFAGDEGVACQPLDAPRGATAVPFVIGAVPFRQGGALRLTAIVKATFSLTAPALVPAAAPVPFHRADVHANNQPLAHVTAASDRVPWKTAADVTLVGHAHAPGAGSADMPVRFALRAGDRALVDKTVRVLGHRITAGVPPKPFTKMPIVYERAHGGASTPANPIGRGETGVPPNIVHPESPWRPAGFGPIAASWPLRHKRLGDTPRSALEGPIVELPEKVDWGYFQSAPPDQVSWELPADATLVLEGLLPDAARFQAVLPGAHAVGAVYGCDDADPDAPTALAFHADTLHVDADQRLVVIVFRACVDLRDDAQLSRVLVAAGVGLGGRVPAIPRRRPERAAGKVSSAQAAPVAPRASESRVGSGTLAVYPTEIESPPPSLPFGRAAVELRPISTPPPPPPPPPAPEPPVVKHAAPADDPPKSPWAPAPPAPPPDPPRRAPAKKAPPAIDVLQKLYGPGAKR